MLTTHYGRLKGVGHNLPDSYFVNSSLEKGTKFELDFFKDEERAKAYAKDNLIKNPRYYDWIRKMCRKMMISTYPFIVLPTKLQRVEFYIYFKKDYIENNKRRVACRKAFAHMGDAIQYMESMVSLVKYKKQY